MKNLLLVLTALTIASCTGVSSPGYGPSPIPGPIGNDGAKDEAYRQGFGFGRRDAQRGKQANYMLYNNYYTSATKKDFGSGYMHGYHKHSR